MAKKRVNTEAEAALKSILMTLADARDAAEAVENGRQVFFDHYALARFSRMGICEAGRELEHVAVSAGLLKKRDCGIFK